MLFVIIYKEMIRELSIQKLFPTKKLTNSKLVTNSFMIHLILRCWGVIRTFLGWVVNLFRLISKFPAGLLSPCPFRHYSHCCISKTRSSNITIPTVEWNGLIFTLVKEVEFPYTLEHFLCKWHYSFFFFLMIFSMLNDMEGWASFIIWWNPIYKVISLL